jgi:pimeloyl-ACP methyl ester carboxylesterase
VKRCGAELALFDDRPEMILVCHSMGGPVTRALLLKYQQLAAEVPMICFFSTPTTGPEIAALAKNVIRRNTQFGDMRPWKDDGYVGNLVRQWQAAKIR